MRSFRPGRAFAVAVPLVVGLAAGYATAQAQASGQARRIGMVGSAFSVAALEARIGDTLLVVNDDTEDHTVFVPSFGWGVNLGTQKPGTEASMTLFKAGRFRVECVNHAAMLLDVTVMR